MPKSNTKLPTTSVAHRNCFVYLGFCARACRCVAVNSGASRSAPAVVSTKERHHGGGEAP